MKLKLDESSGKGSKKEKFTKEKTMKWYDLKEEDENGIDFVKTSDKELVQKIPTLRRKDHN